MMRDQFLNVLEQHLTPLSAQEKQDILQDYEEHFTFGLEAGKTEAEVATSLGRPEQIAKEILANYHIEKASSSGDVGSTFRAIVAVGALSFFNLVFVLGPAIGIAATIFAMWVTAITLLATPLLVIFFAIIDLQSFTWFDFFSSLTACGIGVLLSIGMWYVTKFVTKGFILYLEFNVKLVKGGQ